MIIFQIIFQIDEKELLQVKNGLTTSLLFFFENAKNLGRSDDAKGRKKRGWPYHAVVTHFPRHRVKGEGDRA